MEIPYYECKKEKVRYCMMQQKKEIKKKRSGIVRDKIS